MACFGLAKLYYFPVAPDLYRQVELTGFLPLTGKCFSSLLYMSSMVLTSTTFLTLNLIFTNNQKKIRAVIKLFDKFRLGDEKEDLDTVVGNIENGALPKRMNFRILLYCLLESILK